MGIFGLIGGIVGAQLGGKKAVGGFNQALSGLTSFEQELSGYGQQLGFPEAAFTQTGQDISGLGSQTLQDTLAALREQALSPELSPQFQLLSREGLKQLAQQGATTGSPFSGPTQIAQGRFLAGLGASERERQLQNLYNVSQISSGLLGGGQATEAALGFGGLRSGIFGQRGGVQSNLANLRLGKGLQQAQNIYGLSSGIGQVSDAVAAAIAAGAGAGFGGGGLSGGLAAAGGSLFGR